MSVTEHRADTPSAICCFLLTISDTRTADTDASGDALQALLIARGCTIGGRRIVRDEPAMVRDLIVEQAGRVDVVITTGGTGLTSRDSTIEAIEGVLQKRIAGFGELFRMLSYQRIGAAAMMSRAAAGTIGRTAVFALPGSIDAVTLAMEELIVPEIGHVVRELRR